MDTNTLEQRQRFVVALDSEQWSMSELCERFGISRPTGYKWVARYWRGGVPALTDRSRAPQQCPHRTSEAVAALLLGSTAGGRRSCSTSCSGGIPASCGPRAAP